MDIFLIRHAEAVELGTDGIRDDFARPLTDAGRSQSRRLAENLPKRGVRIERLFVSPLVRARQTAEPLVAAWNLSRDQVVNCDELAPGGGNRELAARINEQPAGAIGLVGHRPDLNEFASWLIGSRKAQIALDKAGVALVRAEDDDVEKGSGELIWLLPPDWV